MMTEIRPYAAMPLGVIAELIGAELPPAADPALAIQSGASLATAEPWHIAFMDDARQEQALRATRAGACLVALRHQALVPDHTVCLVVDHPRHAYAGLMGRLHPRAMKPMVLLGDDQLGTCFIHPTAVIGQDVVMDPGVVVGEGAIIGTGTTIGAHAVVGAGVVIGRDCAIAAGVSITDCRMGDRVIVHPGVRIGQDGFGYVTGSAGHCKMPQLGGVIIGSDVEIGANTTIDRGSSDDTVIGQGTKIDNLVQIGHNTCIGRHCLIAAQAGIAGSTFIDDFVAIGGQAAIADHLRVGRGAQIAAASGVMRDIPQRERWAGLPAKPARRWFREQATLAALARPRIARRRRRVSGKPIWNWLCRWQKANGAA